MILTTTTHQRVFRLAAATVLAAMLVCAADDTATKTPANPAAAQAQEQNDEIARLKSVLAEQQKQLEALSQALARQQQILEKAVGTQAGVPTEAQRPNLGNVTSLAPVLPVVPAALPPIPLAQAAAATAPPANPCEATTDNAVPPYLHLGGVCAIPIGFMDATLVWRDKNPGSGIGSNFGGIPYNNVAAGNLSEFHFSPQNSRIGFRIDGDWKGSHFIGYNEFDFLSSATPGSSGVTNGAFVPRLRLFWVDVRNGSIEFLAGQSWSMLTPNRKGISPLPGDVFFSQTIDVNYMAGLTWTRQPGMRVVYHANEDKVAFGLSFENSSQYIGGSAGGSSITLPAALGALAGPQLDNTTSGVLAEPNLTPDIIAKLALDPSSKFHFEVGGVLRAFKVWDPLTSQTNSKIGGGLQFGANSEIMKNLRFITTNYFSDGGGRYLFGQAPDVIVRADGSLSAVHASGTVDGFEATIKNTLIYAYYGGIYVGRNTALDANGRTLIGYGIAAGSQNRVIHEATFGFNQTLWRNPRYGALNLMGQYEYLTRSPWLVAAGAPESANDNTIYINVRYTLPGSMPAFK